MVLELSEDFKALCARMRELKGYVIASDDDVLVLIELWKVLASEFEAESHHINAGMCSRNAERLEKELQGKYRSAAEKAF